MNTKNLKVKCLTTFNSGKFTEGNFYSVVSAKKLGCNSHNILMVIETNNLGEKHTISMPETIATGDLSISGCFELVVEEDIKSNADDIGDAIQYSIQCGLQAGGPFFAAMRRGDQVTNQQVLEGLRDVLRCPDGANIVIWAEILAAGYFGENHHKGSAIEDAIHYKKNGAYSDETLAKILAAIVNDGTNC